MSRNMRLAYASVDGILAQRDRLCRLRRRGRVSQAARREAARLTRVQRGALIGLVRLTGRAHQPVCLHQHVSTLRLRPKRKADDDEGSAKQQADYHDASVRGFIRVMK